MRFLSLTALALVAMTAVTAKECTTDEAKASVKLDVSTSGCTLSIDTSGTCSDKCFQAMKNATAEAPNCTKGTNTATEKEMAERFFKQCEEARASAGSGASSSLIDEAAIAALTEEPSSSPTATTPVPTTTPASSASLISTSAAVAVAVVSAVATML